MSTHPDVLKGLDELLEVLDLATVEAWDLNTLIRSVNQSEEERESHEALLKECRSLAVILGTLSRELANLIAEKKEAVA